MKDQVLFPKIELREKGFLQVSDIHTIYWERSGNPNGKKFLLFMEVQEEEVNQDIEDTLTQINSILFNLTKEVAVLQLLSQN
jgi:hypothetical protein